MLLVLVKCIFNEKLKEVLGKHPIPLCRSGCSSPAPQPTGTPFSQQDSALATLQVRPTTFFEFENPTNRPY